jgi:hypothetical protein
MLRSTKIVLTEVTRFRGKERSSNVTTFVLALTKCPENLQCRAGIDCKSSIVKGIYNARLTSWCGRDPGVTSAEDIGSSDGTVGESLTNWGARFATGIRGSALDDNIAFGEIDKTCRDECDEKEPEGRECGQDHDGCF